MEPILLDRGSDETSSTDTDLGKHSMDQERKSRIRRVKAILGPKCHERAKKILGRKYDKEEIDKEIDEDINTSVIAMMNLQYYQHHSAEFAIVPSDKPQKAAVKRVAQILRKLNDALRSEHFPPTFSGLLSPRKSARTYKKKSRSSPTSGSNHQSHLLTCRVTLRRQPPIC
jgi:hypothetical protein